MSWSEPVLIKLEQTFNIVVLQKLLNQLQISKPEKKFNYEKKNASTYFTNYLDLTTPCMVSISFFLYFDTESMLTRLILKRSGGKITISLRIEQIKLSKKFGNGGSMIFIGCGSNFVFLFFFSNKNQFFFLNKNKKGYVELN